MIFKFSKIFVNFPWWQPGGSQGGNQEVGKSWRVQINIKMLNKLKCKQRKFIETIKSH